MITKKIYHRWLITHDMNDMKKYSRATREDKKAVEKTKNEIGNERCDEIDSINSFIFDQ